MSRSRKPKVPEARTPSDVVRQRVRELRRAHGYTAQSFADRLHELDPNTALDRDVLANFETGRRPTVSVDEVVLLAYALDESPTAMFVPLELEPPVRIGAGVSVAPLDMYRWVTRGPDYPLEGQDKLRYGRVSLFLDFPDDYERARWTATPAGMRAQALGLVEMAAAIMRDANRREEWEASGRRGPLGPTHEERLREERLREAEREEGQ